jgi:predicted nucleotidyltransferase
MLTAMLAELPSSAFIAALCQRHHVQRLAMFGSAVRTDFDPMRSDIDCLVNFDAVGQARAFDAYFDLKQDLARLFGRSVDLVVERAIRNGRLRAVIAAEERLLYAA